MCPTTSSAASARWRQNSMVLAISSLLEVSSLSSVSSFFLSLSSIYRNKTHLNALRHAANINIVAPARRTQFSAALSSPPPQGGAPPPALPYIHHSESSCLGQGVSIRTLPGTYENLWSSTLLGILPVVSTKNTNFYGVKASICIELGYLNQQDSNNNAVYNETNK